MHPHSPRIALSIADGGAIEAGRLGADGGGSIDEGQIAICQKVITNGYLNSWRFPVMTGDGFAGRRR
jgi:hypothetical protein